MKLIGLYCSIVHTAETPRHELGRTPAIDSIQTDNYINIDDCAVENGTMLNLIPVENSNRFA